jgi:ATP-dependent Lhr-like helicase
LGVRHGDHDDLPSKPHVLVTTPESLDVMLIKGEPALKGVQAAILDEIHLLYNTQRGLQLAMLLRRLKAHTGGPLQWAALSATIGNPQHIRDFFFDADETAEFLSFPSARAIDAYIDHLATDKDILPFFRKLTGGDGKFLVFADSRRECERLCGILERIPALKDSVFAHYSSMSKEERLDTEGKFQRMRTAVCVATSTLELGIDIGDIDAAVLWGVPSGVESFLQRIGRSNRRSQKTNVICLVPDTSAAPLLDALLFAAQVEDARAGRLPAHAPHDLFGAVVQQILSVAVSRENEYVSFAEFRALLGIMEDDLTAMLDALVDVKLLSRHPLKRWFCADEAAYILKDEKRIYGNFPLGSSHIDLMHGSKRLGDIPFKNRFTLDAGDTVRFAGRVWTVNSFKRGGIQLEPCLGRNASKEIKYGGKGIARAPEAIDGIWRMLHNPAPNLSIFSKQLRTQVAALAESVRDRHTPSDLPFVRTGESIRHFTFAGELVNKAICRMAGQPDAGIDEVSIWVPHEIDWAKLPADPTAYIRFASDLVSDPDRLTLFQNRLPRDLLEREFLQSWLKNRAIADILTRLSNARLIHGSPMPF